MRQQISAPAYGIGYKPFQSAHQPQMKLVSQPSFQQPVPPISQPPTYQNQQNYPHQYGRPIIPINGNSSVSRQSWEQPQQQQRFHTATSNLQNTNSPLQVVDLQQVEEPWKQKVQELQNRILELEAKELNRYNDDGVNELSEAYSQIQQLVNTIKQLQEEIQVLQDKLEIKQSVVDGYDKQLADKDKEIEEANHYISELHAQLEDSASNVEEKQKYLFDEVNTWKKKFIEQNKEFHQKQEELMVLQAELDNLKNAQIIISKTSDYKQNK